MNAQEQLHLDKMAEASPERPRSPRASSWARRPSRTCRYRPGRRSGFGGSPDRQVQDRRPRARASAARLASDVLSFLSPDREQRRRRWPPSKAGYERRWDDWKLQESLADKELEQIDTSIAAPRSARHASRRRSWRTTSSRSRTPRRPTRSCARKYTNQELYQWQIGQISGVYFQSYKLAYDLAKRAERCFRFELGLAGQQLHQLRLLGQPEEGPAVRREAAVRPAPARDRVPGAEPPRVRADQARLAGAARPAGAGQAAGDRALLLQSAGGDVRPRLSRVTTSGASSR